MTTPKYMRGLLPLSADPITKGHVHLVKKALQIAQEIIVFVGNNDSKRGKYLFDINQRTRMVRQSLDLAGLEHVRIVAGDALLVGVYIREACDVVIRGVRNAEDRRYEETQMGLHSLIHNVDVEFIEADEGYTQVSSTMVKAFTDHSVDTSPYVDIHVKRKLEVAIKQQWLVGVTGGIATGKSWVTDALVKRCIERGIPATAIKVDDLQRQIYASPTPSGVALREAFGDLFGPEILTEDQKDVNRKHLMALLSDPSFSESSRKVLHHLIKPLVLQAIREARNGTFWGTHPYRYGLDPDSVHGITIAERHPIGGLVFIEWAQMAEMGLSHWVNHNVIVVDTTPETREKFLQQRGIDPETFQGLQKLQWSAEDKALAITEAAGQDGWGDVLLYVNDPEENLIDELIEGVREMLPDVDEWPKHKRWEFLPRRSF